MRVSGVVRKSERPSSFVPPNRGGEWFWVDVSALAAAADLPADTPLVESVAPGEHVKPGMYPQPVEESTLMRFTTTPADHLNYAATWLTLSAAVTAMAGAAIRRRGR